jgi:hypothetical protein
MCALYCIYPYRKRAEMLGLNVVCTCPNSGWFEVILFYYYYHIIELISSLLISTRLFFAELLIWDNLVLSE